MTIDFPELYEAVSDEQIRRWLWNQLPERARLSGDVQDYVIDSLRIRFDPYECDT